MNYLNNKEYAKELYHHGILGMKWGVRRYQNPDGTLTAEGRERYLDDDGKLNMRGTQEYKKTIAYYRQKARNEKGDDIKRKISGFLDLDLDDTPITKLSNKEKYEKIVYDLIEQYEKLKDDFWDDAIDLDDFDLDDINDDIDDDDDWDDDDDDWDD